MSDIKPPVVLAISGSLRSPSFTEKMLDCLLEGMGEVEVHKFYPHKMKIGLAQAVGAAGKEATKVNVPRKTIFN